MNGAAEENPRTQRAVPGWLRAAVVGVFGLLYAYIVWNAVAFLVVQAGGSLGLSALGWFVLLFAVVFPIVVFVGAVAVGRRRRLGALSLVMLAGLALSAVFWLNVLGYAYAYGGQLLG
ncbi:hypothetical protein PU630_09070 [Microbacterium horticulturae]|uniref:Bacitracin resistance protein n=1 Tax=Microbacterium horticulturae TaxID=3028316 RepID=A0ABY8BTD0_9MICO|nr:hypothetical protein [Microbacterium sp. KACC 23027]WEG07420.1 hypothetical protein PU630_09070 [Microbacterium sp. KACC 23027]